MLSCSPLAALCVPFSNKHPQQGHKTQKLEWSCLWNCAAHLLDIAKVAI